MQTSMVYRPSLTVMATYALSRCFLMTTLCSFSDLPKITSWSPARLRAERKAPASSWAPFVISDVICPHLCQCSLGKWKPEHKLQSLEAEKGNWPETCQVLLLRKIAMGPEWGRDPRELDGQRATSALSPSVSFPRVLIRGFLREGHVSTPKNLIQTTFSFTITCFPFYMLSTILKMVANWFQTIFSQPWAFWKWTSVK